MASLKDIRIRIDSVKKTQKTTNAMQMVSAAKLKRAQDAIESAVPYSQQLKDMVSVLSSRFSKDDHPLFAKSMGQRTVVILVTSDRGLCGGFNTNLCKATLQQLGHLSSESLRFTTVGRKGSEFIRNTPYSAHQTYTDVQAASLNSTTEEIVAHHLQLFETQQVDRVYLAYNHFQNVLTQKPTIVPLLPIEPPTIEGGSDDRDVLFEPAPEVILDTLLRKYVQNQIHTACLSSVAGEHASRMTAMDSATKNAGDMIDKLQLHYNRTRQAAITRELIEIVSGAESL